MGSVWCGSVLFRVYDLGVYGVRCGVWCGSVWCGSVWCEVCAVGVYVSPTYPSSHARYSINVID